MKKFLIVLCVVTCLVAVSASALANPSPTGEDLIAPRAVASDEPVVFDSSLYPLTAIRTPGLTASGYAQALGCDVLDPGTADLYVVCHRQYLDIHFIVRQGQIEIYFSNPHDSVVKITLEHTDLDFLKVLYFFATEPLPDARNLEKSDLEYLPIGSLFMVETFLAEFAVDSTGHLVEDDLVFRYYAAEPRFYNYASIH